MGILKMVEGEKIEKEGTLLTDVSTQEKQNNSEMSEKIDGTEG